jgi:hypothetical protein
VRPQRLFPDAVDAEFWELVADAGVQGAGVGELGGREVDVDVEAGSYGGGEGGVGGGEGGVGRVEEGFSVGVFCTAETGWGLMRVVLFL